MIENVVDDADDTDGRRTQRHGNRLSDQRSGNLKIRTKGPERLPDNLMVFCPKIRKSGLIWHQSHKDNMAPIGMF